MTGKGPRKAPVFRAKRPTLSPRGSPRVLWLDVALVACFLAVWSATQSALASTNALPDPLELRFERLRGSDELRDPRILDIVQDRFGFLWLATFSGLVRYDGYEFRWFVSDPEDPHSLSDDRLRCLLVDREGTLWVGTRGAGLNRYDPWTGQFTRYRHDPAAPDSLSHDYVRALYEDRHGDLWIGTDDGLNRLDRKTGGFDRYFYDSRAAVESSAGEAATIVQAITEDRDGHLWVGGYGSGLFELVDGVPVKSYQRDPRNPESLSDNRIMRLVTDASGTIWVSTWGGGVNAFDVETGSFRRYRNDPKDPSSAPGDQLLNLWLDRRDAVWVIATSGGLARLDRDSDRFIRYPHDPGRVGSPNDTLSGAAFEDAGGSLWLGTYGDGVDVWHPSKPKLAHYRAHDGPGGLSDDYVNVVREDRGGGLWAGTYNGLDRMDRAGRVLTTYRHDPASSNSLAASYIFALHEDRDGMLWVGTWGGGLNRLDPRTGRVTRYPCDPENPQNPNALYDCDVRVIYEDTSGSLWVGTFGGLNRFDRRSGRFTHYNHDAREPSSLSDKTVNDVKEDAGGVLWIGTAKGLNRWAPGSRSFVRYEFDPSNPDRLAHREVRVIDPGRDRTLWLGTGGGLQRVSWDGAGAPRFTLYGEDYGLPRSWVVGILDDDEGNLWLATRGDGLWRFNPDTLEARQLDTTDGLPRGGFELPGSRMRDGRFLLGGVDGFVVLDPATVGTNTHVSPVVITGIAIDNQPVPAGPDSVLRQSIAATRELTLLPRARSVSFEFAALDFQAPEKNRYRYRLEGFDEGWTEADASHRRATYTNLSPGPYVFRVKGSNNTGLWNERGTSLLLTVMPAWWQTVWFRFVAALSLLGIFFALHRLRMKYVVEANR